MNRAKKAALLRALEADPSLLDRALVLAEGPSTDGAVTSPGAARAVVLPLLAGLEVERLVVIALDRRRRVVDVEALTQGTDGFTIVDPKHVFRWALTRKRTVSAIILAHNHPSGDPTPSPQDRDVTERCARAGRMLGIPVIDHLVVTDTGYRSMAEDGTLPAWAPEGPAMTR